MFKWYHILVLICISLMVNYISFHMPFGLFFIYLKEMSSQIPLFFYFHFSLLGCKSSLCILDTSPLSDIFSQSVACLFILLTVSFAEQHSVFLKCFLKFVFKRSLSFQLFNISGFFPKIGTQGPQPHSAFYVGCLAPGKICSNERNVLWWGSSTEGRS